MCKKVVIIGGGLGGLFVGAFLAKEGYKIVVVEKNTTIGGGLQSYRRFGVTFDTGMHVIGGMNPSGNLYAICKYLDILQKIRIKNVDDDCTDDIYIATEDKNYKIAKGKDGFITSLSVYFPHQRAELEAYLKAMLDLTKELSLFYLQRANNQLYEYSEDFMLPVNEFIAKYISDEKLRGVLSFQNLLYAGEEDVTPAYIHAVISILYINGPSRFVGGSLHFAEALADVIKESGGEIIAGDGIKKIIVENKQIVKCITTSDRELSGDLYISSIHPSTFIKLLDDVSAFSKAYRQRLELIPTTYSAITLNIKLRPNTFEYLNYMGHYFDSYENIWKNPDEVENWPNICLYLTPPIENQGKYATTLKIIAPISWNQVQRWENTTIGHRGKEYVDWKNDKAQIVIDRLSKIFPHLRSSIEDIDISTPLTIRDFYGVKHGALYGYKKDCKDMIFSRVPLKTKMPNLFFTGQNHNIHGFCGVALTAIETCNKIIGDTRLLDNINKKYNDEK